MKMPTALVLALAVLSTGCASSINPNDSKLARLNPGITTYDEAVALLGQPKTAVAYLGGGRTAIWDYPPLSTNPPQRNPAFPWMLRETGVSTTTVGLRFDLRDTLRYWSADATGQGKY